MNGPSAFYAQHFKLDAPRIDERTFRPYWRIKKGKTRLDRLLDEGAILPIVWWAAIRFRDAARQLMGGGRSYERMPGGGSAADRALYRFQAKRLVQRVQAQLGVGRTALVWSCAVDDLSWAAVGARLGVHPTTAKRRTIAALEALASIEH